jgi:hypothetical protein
LNFTEIGVVPLFIWGWRFLGVLDLINGVKEMGFFYSLLSDLIDCLPKFN